MKLSVTAFLTLALLVVSLGLIVTAAAEGEMNVDAAMAVDDPSVSTLAATDKDGEPDAEGPVSDADDLGPIEDGDEGLVPDEEDGIEGDYNDGLEVDPSDDMEDDDEELADDENEDIVVIDDDEENYNEIDDGYEDPELYDADDNDEFAPETDNADDAERLGDEFAAGEEEGSYPQRDGQKHHHHHHHQEPHIHLRCHPAHIALFLLVAVAIGLASRRLRTQRRAAYQSIAQPPSGEVPVVVVMGKLKEDDDDVSHGGVNDGFPLGRPVSSIPCTAVV